MPDAGSVTRWIDLLRAGDGDAARALWGRYFDEMVRHARRRLGGRPLAVADGEDVAIEAFASFCRDVARSRFPQLDGRLGLKRLLLTMVAQKARDILRSEGAEKRGGGFTARPDALDHAAGREPSPEFAAEMAEECERLLTKLDGEEQRLIAVLKMEGHTNADVAGKVGLHPRRVEDRLRDMRELLADDAPASRTAAYTPAPDLPGPTPQIPGYQIEGELGRGGMGVVYKARALELGRVVALKMTREHAGASELSRFRTEGMAIARLQHANIVQIFEVGEHGGRPFMALEYCERGSLDKELAGKPMPGRLAARLVCELARAIQAAHDARVIHRDLKPANVLITADGTHKITDFGLAKKLDELGETSTGAVMGTFRYMAPEQAEGRRDVGPLADVYGLGAILYECLTGGPPFAGVSAAGILDKVRREPPAAPRDLGHDVHPDLEGVCLKCLEKDPADRYASAEVLAEDLDRFLRGLPTARPESASRIREAEVYFRNVALAEREWADAPQRAGQLLDACRADLRGWEWHCLKALAGGRTLTLSGHEDVVYAVAFSRDGDLLSVGDDKKLRLWDAHTGACVKTLPSHAEQIYSLCFSPDGRRAAGASQAGNVMVWDLASGAARELSGHTDVVVGVAWSRDGKRIASASDDGKVKLWDPDSYAVVQTLDVHDNFVNGVAFSPDGETLASASSDRKVRLWDIASGGVPKELRGHGDYVWCVAFSPDGRLVAAAGGDGTVRLWEAESGREGHVLHGHTGPVHAVVFLGDTRLASAGEDKTVRIWDVASGREAVTLRGHADDVRGLAVGPGGRRLASCGDDRTVRIWDATEADAAGPPVWQLPDHAGPVHGVAYSDGGRLATCGDDRTVRVWGEDRKAPRELKGHTALVTSVAFGPDGLIASASGDKTLRLWDAVGGWEALRGHSDRVYRVAFSPDGTRLASAAWDRTVRVWDVVSRRELFACKHTNWAWDVAFSPDGPWLASCGTDRVVRVWDTSDGTALGELPAQPLKVLGVAFGPGGLIASAGADGLVKLWRWPGREEVATLGGHSGRVRAVAFSLDGRLLASAGEDQTVRVWDVASRRERLVLRGHTRQVNGVAFRPDGRAVASASDDRTVKVWDIGARAESPSPPASPLV